MENRRNIKTVDEIRVFEICQWVRETTSQHLKAIVDSEVEDLQDVTDRTWKLLARDIVKRIKGSAQMTLLLDKVKSNFDASAANVVSDFLNQFSFVQGKKYAKTLASACQDGSTNWEEASTAAFKQQKLAEDTSRMKPLKTRLKAMNSLLNMQVSGTVLSDHWPRIRQNLQDALSDEDNAAFSTCLNLHAHLMSPSSEPAIIRDSLLSLVEGLRSHYSRKFRKVLPHFQKGMSLDNLTHIRLIKISCLILHAAKEIPKDWIKYNENIAEDIIDAILALLTMHTCKSTYSNVFVYPFHILAVIDTEATWCLQWFHNLFSRNLVLAKQSQISVLLRYIIEEIEDYLQEPSLNLRLSNEISNTISSESLKSATIKCCINILNIISSTKSGQKAFLLESKSESESFALQDIFNKLLLHLNMKSKANNSLIEATIANALVHYAKNVNCPFLKDLSFCTILLDPLNFLIDHHGKLDCCEIPAHTLQILDQLTNSECGLRYLLGLDVKLKGCTALSSSSVTFDYAVNSIPVNGYCPAKSIMLCTALVLKYRHLIAGSLKTLIGICSKLYKYHDSFLVLETLGVPLIATVVNLYKQLCLQINVDMYLREIEVDVSHTCGFLSVLTNFLASVASSPLGLSALSHHDSLLADLTHSLFQMRIVPWKCPEFRHLVSLLTHLPEGASAISQVCGRGLSQALNDLWTTLEDEESLLKGLDFMKGKAELELLNIVFATSCTLAGAEALLTRHEDKCSIQGPTTLLDLLALNCSQDPWHYTGLLVLRAMVTNLDTWLYLENRFKLQAQLLQLQSQNVSSFHSEEEEPDSRNIIIDECSLLRNQILVYTYMIGGPNERKLPPLNIDSKSGSLPHLTAKLPLILAYMNKKPVQSKSNSEVQQLLQGSRLDLHDSNWLTRARRALRTARFDIIKGPVLLELVEQVARCYIKPNCDLHWANEKVKKTAVQPEETLGIEITVRYGIQSQMLATCLPNIDNMLHFLQLICKTLHHNRNAKKFKGFDWFAASVFLLCGGDIDRCCIFLKHFTALPVAMILWPALAEAHQISNLALCFSHLLESIIVTELPSSYMALKAAGVSWGLVCYNWQCQAFWNILDWNQICHWLALCSLHQPDMTLYFCVGLLRHLQPHILAAANKGNIWEVIKITPMTRFEMGEHEIYMEKLIRRHRSSILPRLLRSIAIDEADRMKI